MIDNLYSLIRLIQIKRARISIRLKVKRVAAHSICKRAVALRCKRIGDYRRLYARQRPVIADFDRLAGSRNHQINNVTIDAEVFALEQLVKSAPLLLPSALLAKSKTKSPNT